MPGRPVGKAVKPASLAAQAWLASLATRHACFARLASRSHFGSSVWLARSARSLPRSSLSFVATRSLPEMAAAAFEELKALPKDEQHSQVQGLNAEQLRELVHYLGHPKAGTRVDNIPKVLAALEDGGPNSPVGRDGRGRSPKPGRSAYALRSSAASQNEIAAKGVDKTRSPTVEEFIGSGGPKPSAPIPAVQPLPGFMAAVDAAGAGANVVIQTVPGAEIDAAQAQAHAEMAVDESEASDASAVSDAPEVTGEVSTNDLMRKLNTMEKQRKADKPRSRRRLWRRLRS